MRAGKRWWEAAVLCNRASQTSVPPAEGPESQVCSIWWNCGQVSAKKSYSGEYLSAQISIRTEISISEMKVLVTKSCLTLCDHVDCSPPGSSVHGILQAKILEWVAMPSSWKSSQLRIKSRSPALQADSLPSEPPGKPK